MARNIVERFIARLEGLRPTDRTSVSDLQLVRAIAARDIRTEALSAGVSDEELSALDAEIENQLGQSLPLATGALFDSDSGASLTIPFSGLDARQPEPAFMRNLGNFVTRTGGIRDLLLTTPETWDEIIITGSQRPVLLVPDGASSFSGSSINIDFEKGTLWINASLLVEGVPADQSEHAFVGIPARKVKGELAASNALTLNAPVEGKFTIELNFPDGLVDVCAGVQIASPQTLELVFDGQGNVSVNLSNGAVDFNGTQFEFRPTGKLVYDADHQRIVFIASPQPDVINLSSPEHQFGHLDGSMRIAQGGWAFPIQLLHQSVRPSTIVPVGSWVFSLKGTVSTTWDGLNSTLTVTDPWLEIATNGWQIEGEAKTRDEADALNSEFALTGWSLEEGAQPLSIVIAELGQFAMGCNHNTGDFVAFLGALNTTLSRPVNISGLPLSLPATDVSILLSQQNDNSRRINLRTLNSADGATGKFAIENAVFSANNIELIGIQGQLLDNTNVNIGRLQLRMQVSEWLPTLPDPYVTNVPTHFIKQHSAEILVDVAWQANDVSVSLAGTFSTDEISLANKSRISVVGTDINASNQRKGGLTQSGRQPKSKKDEGEFNRAKAIAEDFPGSGISREGLGPWRKHESEFTGPQFRLLDVSTRRDQIGVTFDLSRRGRLNPNFRVSGLRTLTDLTAMRVFALPQIQWEPVRTLDKDQDLITMGYFPSPLASPDDGGATQIASAATTLAPTIPDLTIDAMLDAYKDGTEMQMATTLPFGIKTLMRLRPEENSTQQADRIQRVEPVFKSISMIGGLQLAVEAGESKAPQPTADPGFEGVSFQQPNGVDLETGAPRNISVLGSTADPDGSVEAMFNQEFLFSRPKVPVNRLDISGYGSSTFSDWRNPFAAFAEASKVEFQVMVGRTALEVVKFVSVIYPWGIRVTRSVTIERGAGSGVIRRDSGWQPTSSGLLDFSYIPEGATDVETSPYVVHPGLIRGLFDIRRIRPADRDKIELTQGGAVQPMLFDAEFELGTDDSFVRAPSRGILGYLHLEPVGDPITADDLEQLLDTMGPAGGPLDTDLILDKSGLNCRVVRAEVGSSPEAAGPAFAAAVLSIPTFSTAGSWSVAAFPGPTSIDALSEAAVLDEGVPLIRRGRAGTPINGRINVPTPDPAIRFADASDLFRTGGLEPEPERDFAFLQVCPTHSFAYRRPYVEAGATEILAGLPALFADVVTRTAGSALFPPEDMTITLPASTKLTVDAGVPRLSSPINMSVTRGPITLSESESAGALLEYGGTTLSLDIGRDNWSVMMPSVEIQNTILGISNVSGIRFDLVGGNAVPDRLDNVKSLLGGFFNDVFEAIPGLSPQQDMPPYELRATNAKHKVKFKVVLKFKASLSEQLKLTGTLRNEIGYEELAVPEDKLPAGVDSLEVTQGFYGAGIGFTLRGEIPVGGGYLLVIGVGWELGFQRGFGADIPGGDAVKAKTKVISNTRIEAGAGYGGDLGPFEAKGYLIGIFLYTVQGNAIGFGLGVRWEFKAKILIAEVSAYMEAIGILLLEDSKKYIVGQAEVGINVKICAFFSIKFSLAVSVKGEI